MKNLIDANIRRHRQHVVAVYASADSPPDFLPFIYTIGNYEAGLPELLMIGDASALYGRILNICGEIQRGRGIPFGHGELVDFSAPLPARAIDAGLRGWRDYATLAGAYYGIEAFAIRQLLLPDRYGRFPGEADCLPPYCAQPVLTATH